MLGACSICAPNIMTADEVVAFATESVPTMLGPWHAIDKSTLGLGGKTPNPCNQFARGRQHWFLLAEKAIPKTLLRNLPTPGEPGDSGSDQAEQGGCKR